MQNLCDQLSFKTKFPKGRLIYWMQVINPRNQTLDNQFAKHEEAL